MSSLWVFSRGALGDTVLLWPFLRAAKARGRNVTFVTDGSKAKLAQAELGITGLDAEQGRFNALWREGAVIERIPGVGEVLSFDVSAAGPSPVWSANAARMFPGAILRHIPQRPDRQSVARLVAETGGEAPVAERPNEGGPVVIHIGAGSRQKRWDLAQFAAVVSALREAGYTVRLIAGEAEGPVNQPPIQPSMRTGWLDGWLDASILPALDDLAATIRPARLFIGCDTGPTHLAAQMGIATLALFGPTNPAVWGPVGPCVRVLAPPAPTAMDWLAPDRVLDEARSVLARR